MKEEKHCTTGEIALYNGRLEEEDGNRPPEWRKKDYYTS